ncbi:MAG TPA: bifunctional ornithine acetyltransferase/N-acetylglutamate synthase, partial [Desulfobacterales bacterium]|nr:bifunctional ornithine acetyltransferase/N-acetylglutamate synthase [Desulfobacterales bacterium]
AGMIMPNMATMLSFIMTDAVISPALLREMLPRAVEQSFNRITVDGDTSTNDTVIIMASGRSGGPEINDLNSPEAAAFAGMLHEVTRDLALQIVADGEGATKLVTILVRGARTDAEAELAARTVANSALVKTAFFGSDPNWGRIMAALGRSGAAFNPARLLISVGDNELIKDGRLLSAAAERSAALIMARKEFSLTIDLKAGEAEAEIYTCDLSLDYVRINADYRT